METVVTLQMKFLDREGKIRTVSLIDPKDGISDAEIENAMNAIITANIFTYNFVKADSAILVTKTQEELLNESDFVV